MAGFVAVLVGFASSVAIVFQAAAAAGASQAEIASWIAILGLMMGVTCIGFSWYYRAPVLTAWSTPGAALLATSLQGVTLAEAVGVFIFSAALTTVLGLSGWFDKLASRIPLPIAAAMLAGILLQFGLQVFRSIALAPELVLLMIATFLIVRRRWPRYVIPLVLLIGMFAAWGLQLLDLSKLQWQWLQLVWVTPDLVLASDAGDWGTVIYCHYDVAEYPGPGGAQSRRLSGAGVTTAQLEWRPDHADRALWQFFTQSGRYYCRDL